MSGKRFWAAFGLALAPTAAALAAPLEAFGKLPTVEAVSLSPNGQKVALVVTNGEQRIVAVEDLASHQILLRAGTGTVKIRYVRWAGDDHLLLVKTVTASPLDVMTSQREWMMAFSLDIASKKVVPLMREADYAMNTIQGLPVVRTVDGKPAVFVQGIKFIDGQGRLSLFRVNLADGRARVVETGSADTRDWVVGADGEPLAQELYDPRSGRWSIKLRSGSAWRETEVTTALLDPPDMIGAGREPNSVLLAGSDARHHGVWREVRADGVAGSPSEMIAGQRPLRDEPGGPLLGYAALVGDEPRYVYFDPQDAKVWKAVTAAFPGCLVSPESWSADHAKVVVRVDSPTDGPAYALVDLATKHATWLGAEYQGLDAADIGQKTPLRFTARDGLALTGYLTLPPGKTAAAKNLPLVVFPHGGPAARDDPGFEWWAEAMASRGYAVLQVNFRGSAGFGDALLEAGFGQWGRKMQTDLSDGVKALVDRGVVDPKRVCIVGGSYGGYAALAGAALDPGVYRCAASWGGLSDMRRFVLWAKDNHGAEAFRYWTRFSGASDARDPVLAQISPAAHVDQVTIPILLIHGKDDSVVPLEQSQIMAEALRKAGKPVELVIEPGEDHWLSRGETRLQMLSATMAFVEKYNPPN